MLTTRRIETHDVEAVAALHELQNGRPADRESIARCVAECPSVLCVEGEGVEGESLDGDRLVGFAYTRRFAPDILELTSVLVDEEMRGRGVGSRLIGALEEAARPRWAALILTNSELLPHPERSSPLAFYAKNGYDVVFTTAGTTVLMKSLVAPS